MIVWMWIGVINKEQEVEGKRAVKPAWIHTFASDLDHT
ncbi:hypothetical protein JCM19233_147 [Vibrio astriarenae]|nr:hypothetical protein JCM19233_147 [Vibrio sp. C7]